MCVFVVAGSAQVLPEHKSPSVYYDEVGGEYRGTQRGGQGEQRTRGID